MISARIHDKRQGKLFAFGILAFMIYIPFHSFFTAWIGSLTEVYAPVKIWKDIGVAAVASSFFVYSFIKPEIRKIMWADPLNLLILSYVGLHFLLFLIFHNFSEESSYAGLIINLRFLALFILIRIALIKFPFIRAHLSRNTLKTILAGALAVGVIAVIQVLIPLQSVYEYFGYDGVNTIAPVAYVDNDPSASRAFSTLRGPNELGSYMILPIIAAIVIIFHGSKKWHTYAILAVFIAALVFSYSRSAFIGALVALVAFLIVNFGGRLSMKLRLSATVIAVMASGLLLWGSMTIPQLRLFVFHSSPGDPSLLEGSTQDHFAATIKNLGDAINNPYGRGPGEAGPASFYQTDDPPRIAENYYVQLAQEAGYIGLGMFLIICAVLGLRLFRQRDDLASMILLSSLIGLSVTNLFLHTWADDTTAYLWWGYAAMIVGIVNKGSKKIHETPYYP